MDGIPKNTFLQNTSGWVLLEYILLATTLSYEIENWINNYFGRQELTQIWKVYHNEHSNS